MSLRTASSNYGGSGSYKNRTSYDSPKKIAYQSDYMRNKHVNEPVQSRFLNSQLTRNIQPSYTRSYSIPSTYGNNFGIQLKSTVRNPRPLPPRYPNTSSYSRNNSLNENNQINSRLNRISSSSSLGSSLTDTHNSRLRSHHLYGSVTDITDIRDKLADTQRHDETGRLHYSHRTSVPRTYSSHNRLPSVDREYKKLPEISKLNLSSKAPDDENNNNKANILCNENNERQNNQSSKSQASSESVHPLGLVGLKNLGNTCYMNSILQCLSHTKALRDYCLSDNFKSDINKTTSPMKGTFITAYSKLIRSLWKVGADSSISPAEFKSNVSKHIPRFTGYSQQDAQEFLIYLLEGLHEDVNRVTTKKRQLVHEDGQYSQQQAWDRYLECNNSKIVDIFVGQLKSSLTCLECNFVSNTFDPFWDLSLPVKKKSAPMKLAECFELFTCDEILDADEKPTCEKCKKRQKCVKNFSIQKFPKVLVIHLKRFDHSSYQRSKLSTNVDFPLKNLDLTDFSADKSTTAVYDLYGVSNHSGSPSFGHYTAYCKHGDVGSWHSFNDTRVSSIADRYISSPEGYVLFYQLME